MPPAYVDRHGGLAALDSALAGAPGVLVVGLGRSGMAAVELLCREGMRPAATDAKPPEEMPEAAARLEQLNVRYAVQGPEIFREQDLIVLSPGVPADLAELRLLEPGGERRAWTLAAEPVGPAVWQLQVPELPAGVALELRVRCRQPAFSAVFPL